MWPRSETRKKSLKFSTNEVLYRPFGFLQIIVPGCLFHNFLQTKITEIDLEVWKSEIPRTILRLLQCSVFFFLFF